MYRSRSLTCGFRFCFTTTSSSIWIGEVRRPSVGLSRAAGWWVERVEARKVSSNRGGKTKSSSS